MENCLREMGCGMEKTIFLVDDEEETLIFVSFALKHLELNYRLRYAANGFHALKYLQGCGGFVDRRQHAIPDLILLDLNMPLMDGFELLEWLRNQSGFEHLPVVALTDFENLPDLTRAYRLGANSFVTKMDDLLDFADSLKQVLDTFVASPAQTRMHPSPASLVRIPSKLPS